MRYADAAGPVSQNKADVLSQTASECDTRDFWSPSEVESRNKMQNMKLKAPGSSECTGSVSRGVFGGWAGRR